MYDTHALRVLEFEEVKALIARMSHWERGRKEVMALVPLKYTEDIYELQQKIGQVREIIDKEGSLPLQGLIDIEDVINASMKEFALSISDLLQVRTTLSITSQLKRYLIKWSHLPYIGETVDFLTTLPQLERTLTLSFSSEGQVLDSASATLREIRQQIRDSESQVVHRLENMLRDLSLSKMIQEQVVTLREGRYVIPIKSEYRGVFEGLVLDSSGSGATVFMEPLGVIELNNGIREGRSEEKREIDRIVRNLSSQVSQNSKALIRNLEIMAHLDMIGALAHFAIEKDCIIPAINQSGHLRLKKARHPLIGKKAVPIDAEIGSDFSILIITGPNTGGKTVGLKTMGLFTLMALSGIPIPADEGSTVSHFSQIFADIGDEQSISQNLSTFSSHMGQITAILQSVDEKSLVLLDELGAGTDPKEGTALAIAILEHLGNLGVRTVVTTHFGELKFFATTFEKARNAAVEFDSVTLEPSYKIIVGLPGQSCALSIAGRLGMPSSVLSRAEELVSQEYVAMDRLIASLKEQEKEMERELEQREKAQREASHLRDRYREELSFVKTEEVEILTEATSEAEILIHQSRSEIKKSLKEFRKHLKDLEKAGKKASPQEAESFAEEALSKLDRVLERLVEFKEKKKLPSRGVSRSGFNEGEMVYIPSLEKRGEIQELKDDELLLQVDKLKLSLPYWKVEKVPPEEQKRDDSKVIESEVKTHSSFAARLDMRGMHVDEALFALEKHIDSAVLGEVASFHIIHGKGTGALRNAIQLFLKKHPAVLNYRLGEAHEGSWGVTVVNLK